MHGTNPIRPPEKGDGTTLQVQEIFPTLQGEGPYAGHPAVFIRLGGCNLACAFCDTEFESFRERKLYDILKTVEAMALPLPPWGGAKSADGDLVGGKKARENSNPPPLDFVSLAPPQGGSGRRIALIVITGGEPLRQPIAPLCEALLAEGYMVQIETNGTLYRPLPEAVEIVCSPKVTNGGYHTLRPDLLSRVNALKFLISAQRPEYAVVPDVGQRGRDIPVYVQPMDEYDQVKNTANLQLAETLAEKEGALLSRQMHKEWGIP